MPSSKPALDVWDSCCLLGILNEEKDKLPALLSQTQKFGDGSAILGIPSVVVSEIVTLSDGSSAEDKVNKFLDNPYVELLQATRDVATTSSRLQFRFNGKQMPRLKEQAIAAGVPKDNAKLTRADSDILATAMVYKASRLTTYDPFLRYVGDEFISRETGIVIGLPDSSWLPLEYHTAQEANPGAAKPMLPAPAGRTSR
jgi:hypothetical protein